MGQGTENCGRASFGCWDSHLTLRSRSGWSRSPLRNPILTFASLPRTSWRTPGTGAKGSLMELWRQIFVHGMNTFNFLIVSYFLVGNGVYTLLMVLSLATVWLYNRRLAYHDMDEIRESSVTPPVTIVIPHGMKSRSSWRQQSLRCRPTTRSSRSWWWTMARLTPRSP